VKRLFLILPLIFGSCTNKEEAEKTDSTIVTTVAMIADVARQIAGDDQEIINLIGEGIDPHMHQPSKSEIDKIQKAGLVLYHGLFFEGKMASVLKSRADKGHPISAVAEELDVQLIGSETPDPHLWMDV
jgi:manganese/zinc/iron transport system substrate-binding protein